MHNYARDANESKMYQEKKEKIAWQIFNAVDKDLISQDELLEIIDEVFKRQNSK